MTAPWQEVVIGYMEWLRQTKGTEEHDRVKEDFREWALGEQRAPAGFMEARVIEVYGAAK